MRAKSRQPSESVAVEFGGNVYAGKYTIEGNLVTAGSFILGFKSATCPRGQEAHRAGELVRELLEQASREGRLP